MVVTAAALTACSSAASPSTNAPTLPQQTSAATERGDRQRHLDNGTHGG